MSISFCLEAVVPSLILTLGKVAMSLFFAKVKENIFQDHCKSQLLEVCPNKSYRILMVRTSCSLLEFNQRAQHLLHLKGLLRGHQRHRQDNYLSFSKQKMKVPLMR